MLRLIPKHWYSWDFRLEDRTGTRLADVIVSAWRQRGSVVAAGVQYKVSRDGLTGPYVLESAGRKMARAVKPSLFRQAFRVSHGEGEYTLQRTSWWRGEFGVFEGSRRVGVIAPASWLTRRATVTLPGTMPIWLQAFMVWLAALMWKRSAER
jgi:hypothetical protein